MFLLASSSFNYRSRSVLHLVHPLETKNSVVAKAQSDIRGASTQVAKVGEHILSANRFNSFDTVVLHTCSIEHLKDYLRRLNDIDLKERLRALATHPKKQLIILGNALAIAGPKANIFYFKSSGSSSVLDISKTQYSLTGLKLLSVCFDCDFTSKSEDTTYTRLVRRLGSSYPLYLLSNQGVLDHNGVLLAGELFVPEDNGYAQISRAEVAVTYAQKEHEKKRDFTDQQPQSTHPDVTTEVQDKSKIDKVHHKHNKFKHIKGKPKRNMLDRE